MTDDQFSSLIEAIEELTHAVIMGSHEIGDAIDCISGTHTDGIERRLEVMTEVLDSIRYRGCS